MFPNIIFFFSFLKFANFLYIIYMKPDEPKFLEIFVHTSITGLFVLFSLQMLIVYGRSSASGTASVFFFFSIMNVWIAFRKIKPKLLGIHYDGENAHLFPKYIAMQELLITVGIAFLVGVVPAFCEYKHIPSDSYTKYVASISSLWLACVANTYKCMLVHTRTVWIANHSKRIYDEANELSQDKDSNPQSVH